MRKKILCVIAIMFFVLIGLTRVEAKESLFATKIYTDIYKLSEQDTKIDLPFINLFTNTVTYDEIVKHSGITWSNSTVDINEKLEGVHIIYSSDMVTIKGEVENALIYGNNIVVEGKISGDTILMAPTVQILDNAIVSKDVIIVANNLDLKGTVEGNVIASVSEKAIVSGEIKNDLRMIVMDLEIETDNIKGDIYIETDADMTSVKEKYPNAVIEKIVEEQQIDWMGIITKGIITVVIYSVVCFFITRKDNNIATIAYNKFKSNVVFGVITAFVIIILLLILPIILIVAAYYGLGIIAWPILTVQLAAMILIWQLSMLIVGTTIFEATKNKLGKVKIPAIVLIFTVLFVLGQITYISMQVNMAIYLIAIAIVATYIMKKLPKAENIKANKE